MFAPRTSSLCVLVFATTIFPQTLERPAESRTLAAEHERERARVSQKLDTQHQVVLRAERDAAARPRDLKAQIVAGGEKIRMLSIIIDAELVEITHLEKAAQNAISLAHALESQAPDARLAKQIEELAQLFADKKSRLSELLRKAETTPDAETQHRLEKELTSVENLDGALQMFREAQNKENQTRSIRLERAKRLQEQVELALYEADQHRFRIHAAKGEMAKVRIDVVDWRSQEEVQELKQAMDQILSGESGRYFDSYIKLRPPATSGSLVERARRLLGSETESEKPAVKEERSPVQ